MNKRIGAEGKDSGTPLWKWVAIGIVAAVVIALVAVFPAIQPSSDSSDGTQQFRSPSARFLLDYPDDWQQLTGKELDRFEGFSFVARHEKINALLSVRIEKKTLTGASLKELESKLDETIAQQSTGFVKHSADTVKIESGEPALRYDYSAKIDNGKAVRRVALIVPDGDRVYFLSAWVEEADYQQARGDIEQSLATFRLN